MTRGLGVKKHFSEEQIIGFLLEAEAGMPIKDLGRRRGFSESWSYLWRSKFGGMNSRDAKRLKDLEAENTLEENTGKTGLRERRHQGCVKKKW